MEELSSEIFILALIINVIKFHGKNLMMQKIMTRITIAQIIMMLMLINMVLIVEYDKDFGKIEFELIL